jgi:NifU-like protein involved in Fe-S cluster formation
MSDLLYRKDLLRLAADARGAGRLPSPDATGLAYNPACGDRVTADVALSNGSIVGFAHETKACVLAQASASILGANIGGADLTRVEQLRACVEAMLKGAAAPPLPFDGYSAFSGAVEYRSRHRCVLLPIDAVLDAFGKVSPGPHRLSAG